MSAGAGAGAGAGSGSNPAAASTGGKSSGIIHQSTLPEEPLKDGTRVIAELRNESMRRAEIIFKRKRPDHLPDLGHAYDYYVHYSHFNRRMDTWLSPDMIEIDRDHCDEATKATLKPMRERPLKFVETYVDPDEHDEHGGMSEEAIKEHEEVTKVKNVNFIQLGRHKIEAWYFSPYPAEYHPSGFIDTLYYCEFCLKFFRHDVELHRHLAKCKLRHPPGNEIYRNDNISVFEVDGSAAKQYAQSLCYLAKCFLDHKTLYYDVDPFLFYIICKLDEYGYHIVGYFSKEKYSEQGYNLACILTLPPYQRMGFGRFIIQFSYELSRKEGKVGSPEKPLSDLGNLSYRSYWSWVLLNILKETEAKELSVTDLMKMTSFTTDDIVLTLQHLGLLRYINGSHVISIAPELVDDKWRRLNGKKGPIVDPTKLHWAPLRIMTKKRDKWRIQAKLKNPEHDS